MDPQLAASRVAQLFARGRAVDIAVIGLGEFGQDLARELLARGAHVMGIDRDHDRAHRLQHRHFHGVVMDATDEEGLGQLGVDLFAAAVITMHGDLASTMPAIVSLKRLGAPLVICSADGANTRGALLRVGANRVLLIHVDSAQRLAQELVHPRLKEFMVLAPARYLATVELPADFAARPLSAMDMPDDGRQVTILAVRRGEQAHISPTSGFLLMGGDLMLVLGSEEAIAALADSV